MSRMIVIEVKMQQLSTKVLEKMTFDRLKKHRTSVLAYISSRYYTTDVDGNRTKAESHGSPEFVRDIEYRDTVNKFYDAAKNSPKLK